MLTTIPTSLGVLSKKFFDIYSFPDPRISQHFLEEAKRRTSVGNTAASKQQETASADSSMDSSDSSSSISYNTQGAPMILRRDNIM